MEKGAIISTCGQYRYTLWRVWSDKPQVIFIGLNPSTADGNVDDRTIGRLMRFAGLWGHGGMLMLNLFAFRATAPADMKAAQDSIGPENHAWLRYYSQRCGTVVFCWGCDGNHLGRDRQVEALFPNAQCFGTTKEGHPKHPLYLPCDTKLTLFQPAIAL